MGNRRYQIVLCAACVLPALLFQTVVPVFPAKALTAWLEGVNDRIYPLIAGLRSIKAKAPSRVAIVEIDDATLKAFGWPIDRAQYVRFFTTLAEHGHPPVLSLLHFQEGPSDDELAESIRDYETVIGSSLEFEKGQELDDKEERFLVAKSLLGRKKLKADDLPYLPLKLREARKFLRGEKHVGTGARFGTEARVFCVPLYYDDAKKPGSLVVPSALVYAAAEMAAGPVRLANGITVSEGRAPKAKATVLEEQHCAPQASVSTDDYLVARKLATLSFLDVVGGKRLDQLKGKLVVLTSSETRKVKGPGDLGTIDGITTEYRMAARLLDGVISGDTVRRPPLRTEATFAWLPLAAGAALLLLGFWAAPGSVVATSALFLFATLAFSVVQLYLEQKYRVPIQALLSLGLSLALFSANAVVGRMVAFKHYIQVMRRFREGAARAVTLEELEAATQTTLKARFPECGVTFEGRSPLLSRKVDLKEQANAPRGETSHEFQEATPPPCGGYVRHYVYRLSLAATKRTQTSVMVIDRDTVTLGLAHLSVKTDTWDFWLVDRVLSNVCQELLAHWDRLETSQKQKLTEYRQFVVARELDLGREVQSLLHPPSDEGVFGRWRYRFRYQPYGLMAGDWVQAFIPDSSGKVAILAIGDVVGKGTSAALITSAIAGIWLRHARTWREADQTLGKDALKALIGDLDQTIRELFREKQYSTLALALLTEDQAIVTSIATSPWMNVSVQKPRLVGKSFCDPLGVEKTGEGRIVLDEISPAVGDLLVACTDGVMEGRVPQMRFMAEMDKLKQVYTTLPLDLVEKALFAAGKETVLDDDQTLIILEYLSEAEAKQGSSAALNESA